MSCVSLCLVTGTVCLFAGTAQAFTCTDAATGNWNVAGTWANCGGGTPGAGDNVTISTYTVHLTTSPIANVVTLSGGTIDGAGTLTGSSYAVQSGTISAILAGAVNLTKSTAGTATLSGANTYTGTTAVNAGTLLIGAAAPSGANGALGNAASTVTVGDTSGSADAAIYTSGAFTVARKLSVQAGSSGIKSIGGFSADASTFSGTIGLNDNVTLYAASGGNATLSGIISGAFNITQSGTGTVTLSGNNTYTGTTTITQGTIAASVIVDTGTQSKIGHASSVVVLGDATHTGTLSYTGNTATYIRGFTVNAGGGEVDVTGAAKVLTIGTVGITASGLFTKGGAGTLTQGMDLSFGSDLTVAAGKFDTSSSNYQLDVTGNLTIAGTLKGEGSTINVAGNWDSSAGTYTSGTSTVNLTGTKTLKVKPNQQIVDFYNLSAAYSSMTTTVDQSAGYQLIAISNVMTVNGGTLTNNGLVNTVGFVLEGSGTPFVFNSPTTFPNYNIEFIFDPAVAGDIYLGGNFGAGSMDVSDPGSHTFYLASDLTVNNYLNFYNATAGQTSILNTNDHAMTIGALQFGGAGEEAYAQGAVVFNAGASVINVLNVTTSYSSSLYAHTATLNLGTSQWTDGGVWNLNQTNLTPVVNPGTSTVKFSGTFTSATTISSVGQSFYNVQIGDTTSTGSITVTPSDTMTVAGNLTVDNTQATALDLTGQTLNVAGNLDLRNLDTFTSTGSTVVLNGADQTIYGSSTFNNLTKDTTSAAILTLASGTTQTIAAGGTLTLKGRSGNLLTVIASAPATKAVLNVTKPSASFVVDYVNPTYIDSSGGSTIVPTNSSDGSPASTNVNWCFLSCPSSSMLMGMTF
jgi:fibronectin-binding autotransporter adhesin